MALVHYAWQYKLNNSKRVFFEGHMVAPLVPFPPVSQAASPTAETDRTRLTAPPGSASIWSCFVGNHLVNSGDFCQPFQETQKLEITEGNWPFVSPPHARDPSWSQAEPGFPVNTLLNRVFLSPKVVKVTFACTRFINHLIWNGKYPPHVLEDFALAGVNP